MRTRFAPSPTGYLHLGHVLNAIWVWREARERGGEVLLRIEDHDGTRCRPEYEAALLDDLDWLGFAPDVGPSDAFRAGRTELRQSNATHHYEAALDRLRAQGLAYVCGCSRRRIAAESPDIFNAETRYPGTCRRLGLEPGPGRGWRVVMDEGTETFDDLRLGQQAQEPAQQCGDVLVRDRLGNWTYQFAVVVDDLRQGIDVVVRGEDLLASTGRQIRLARLLGRSESPLFLHHPLIRKPSGEKLSKASRDTGIRELRAAGASATEVLRFVRDVAQGLSSIDSLEGPATLAPVPASPPPSNRQRGMGA